MLKVLILITFSLSVFAAKDPIVATVNGIDIKKSEFLKAYRQRKLFVNNQFVTKQSVLEDLIARIVGIQKAEQAKLAAEPAVEEKIQDILYNAQVSRDLEGELAKIEVSDEDVEKYYKENKEIRTAQILLRVKANPKPDDVNQILKAALKIRRDLDKDPNKFAELANKFSQVSARKNGGDMGFNAPVRYAPEYFSAIKGKPVGHITQPVRSQFGFHIIKVLGVKDFKDINKGVYKKIVYDIKRDSILARYKANLIKNAKVVVNKGELQNLE